MNQQQIKIIDGSRELFYKYGIKRVTMDEIAHHIGMSKKTIYGSFADKDELVTSLSIIDFKTHEKEMQRLSKQSGDAIEEIVANMKYMAEVFSGFNSNLMFDMHKYHRNAWKAYMNFKSKCVANSIDSNIRRGIKEGLYREDMNMEILSQLRIAEMDFAFNPDVFPPSKFSMVTVQIELVKHFIYGIATLKGHQLLNKLLKAKIK